MFQLPDSPQLGFDRANMPGGFMSKGEVWKLRAAELRLIASRSREPERERKMLALADQLEERERDKRERERPSLDLSPR